MADDKDPKPAQQRRPPIPGDKDHPYGVPPTGVPKPNLGRMPGEPIGEASQGFPSDQPASKPLPKKADDE